MGKQVKTPRFYVDMPTFLHATGQLGWDDIDGGAELLYMSCANPFLNTEVSDVLFQIGANGNIPKTSFPINFVALLNHNLGGVVTTINANSSPITPTANVINYDTASGTPTYNGTSIFTFTEFNSYWLYFNIDTDSVVQHQLGSFVVGKYWDAPNSPDLSLTMSRRFDGIKKQKTIGGKTLANIYYDGPTEWTMNGPNGTYKYPPFELDLPTANDLTPSDFNQIAKSGLGRKGLRSWKLTFSYISEDDMWTAYESSSRAPFEYTEDGEINAITDSTIPKDNGVEVSYVANPMLSDDSFNFVWNCTLGGTLPFIFQPDKTNNNTDQFSICNFRGNSLSVTQVAHNTYKLSITIDEVA